MAPGGIPALAEAAVQGGGGVRGARGGLPVAETTAPGQLLFGRLPCGLERTLSDHRGHQPREGPRMQPHRGRDTREAHGPSRASRCLRRRAHPPQARRRSKGRTPSAREAVGPGVRDREPRPGHALACTPDPIRVGAIAGFDRKCAASGEARISGGPFCRAVGCGGRPVKASAVGREGGAVRTQKRSRLDPRQYRGKTPADRRGRRARLPYGAPGRAVVGRTFVADALPTHRRTVERLSSDRARRIFP